MRRIIVALMLATLVALSAAGTAWAKPITITTHYRELQEGGGGYFLSPLACQGDQLYRTWAPDNNVFHVTAAGVKANGDFIPPFIIHFSGFGRVVAVPVDGTGPTFTGHLIEGPMTLVVHRLNVTFVDHVTIIAKGSDGSRLHFRHTQLFHVNANGKVTVVRESLKPVGCYPVD